jgi:hypothetical protein
MAKCNEESWFGEKVMDPHEAQMMNEKTKPWHARR